MISHYTYCGISTCQNGSKRIWCAVVWVDGGGYTNTYLAWGSPKNPLIKKYMGWSNLPRAKRLPARIKEKRATWSSYIEVTNDVSKHLPELESQIGMHILAKKLKHG